MLSERLDRNSARRHAYKRAAVGARPDYSRPTGTDLLPQIEHIVVLMMENHSYDNYFGVLDRGDGLPAKPVSSSGVAPYHLPSPDQIESVPTQSWDASHIQYNGGSCDGFVTSVQVTEPDHADRAAVSMGYFDGGDLPFYYGLARAFTLADRWFCSCLGPTFPNRRFLISGTSNGLTDDDPYHLFDSPPNGTIFDALTAHGISWRDYHPGSRAGAIAKRVLGAPGLRLGRLFGHSLARIVPQLLDLADGKVQFTADLYPLGLGGALSHLASLDTFFQDAARGTLPAFCIVDPDFHVYSEENPQDVRLGESFAADVITAVMNGSNWSRTLLIWLYDEHGGYFDHVPPPEAVPPDGRDGPPSFDRLGFRVPAVFVSPYARRGAVDSTVYDHSSVLRLVEQKWNLPPLTRRDAHAIAPVSALDLAGAPELSVPPLPAPALGAGAWRRASRARRAEPNGLSRTG